MAFLISQFQIVSDLHLETPLLHPQYASFNIKIQANNILLLGDIGLVKDEGLFVFLRRCLDRNRGVRMFYVLGNHEPYHTTLEDAIQKLRAFEKEARSEYGGRFKFLHRDRYDIGLDITILGCTLWSAIQPHQSTEIHAWLTEFNVERGIRGWTPSSLTEEHRKDLAWLNAQVSDIQAREPQRQILIATHHCPTVDPRATDPAHADSPISSAFVSDISEETCWTSPAVKMWAFGHTHYSCEFRDEKTGKLVLSNQKGYKRLGQARVGPKCFRAKIVEAKMGEWQAVDLFPGIRTFNEVLADHDSEVQVK
jgi:hypothetical protein